MRTPRTTLVTALMIALIICHGAMLAWMAWRNSPTNDEIAHLPAGISHWQTGSFDLFRVNPPLVRLVAALPVLVVGPITDWSIVSHYPQARSDFEVGSVFTRLNGARSFWLYTLARWACLIFSLTGAYFCYRFASELYGSPWSGLLALALWCVSPNILAHGSLITADAAMAALGITAAYAFWRWLQAPSWRQALLAGLALGLAELAKTPWLILYLLWPVLWCLYAPWRDRRHFRRQLGQLAAMAALSLLVINLGYGFEGSGGRLADYTLRSRLLTSLVPVFGEVPLPLPYNYVQGIDVQSVAMEQPQYSFLNGEWRMGGWWYYYLYTIAYKTPIGLQLLFLMALAAAIMRPQVRLPWRQEAQLWLPALVLLVVVSAHVTFNKHYRYLLPIEPFVFVFIARLALLPRWRPAMLLAFGGMTFASLSVYPHSLSFFNAFAGGPENGANHLQGSNIDWGQDLLYLRDWQAEHPKIKLHVAYYPGWLLPPSIAGFHEVIPDGGKLQRDGWSARPAELTPGWYAVSVTHVYKWNHRFDYFRRFTPVARVGYSIYIYHLTPADLATGPLHETDRTSPRKHAVP